MNKVIITMISIIVVLSAVIFGTVIFNNKYAKNNEQYETTKVSQFNEEIEDECTEEWETMGNTEKKEAIQANSNEVKISPKGVLVLKKKYIKCDHLINQYIDIPTELVNKTEKDLKEQYKDWKIEEFSSNKIVIYKEYDQECGQHFILRDKNGKIVINKINENGKEIEYENTDIATSYLTQTDKSSIEKGLKVYGQENLNQIIEDFE